MNKKGFFFILDAVLAMTVLSVGLFVFLSSYTFEPDRTQIDVVSEDLTTYLLTTTIEDLNDPYAGIGGTLWNQGHITVKENSLLTQIGEFHNKNKIEIGHNFTDAVLEQLIPSQYAVQITVNNLSLFPHTGTSEVERLQNQSRVVLVKEKVIFGIDNLTTLEVWGPATAAIYVWQQ